MHLATLEMVITKADYRLCHPQRGEYLGVTPKRISKTALNKKESYLDPIGCHPIDATFHIPHIIASLILSPVSFSCFS